MLAASPGQPVDPVLAQALVAEWLTLRPRLVAIAYKLSRSRELAQDLVDDAYLALLEGRRVWNRAKQPSLADFAASVVGSLWSNHIRGGSARFELDTYTHRPDYAPSPAYDPEQLSAKKEEHALFERRHAELVASFEETDLCRAILALYADGVTGTAQLAEHLGVDPDAIKKARRRLEYAIEKLREREG